MKCTLETYFLLVAEFAEARGGIDAEAFSVRKKVYRQTIVGELRLFDEPDVGRKLRHLAPVYVHNTLTTAKL